MSDEELQALVDRLVEEQYSQDATSFAEIQKENRELRAQVEALKKEVIECHSGHPANVYGCGCSICKPQGGT